MSLNDGLGLNKSATSLVLFALQFCDADGIGEVGILGLLLTALELIDPLTLRAQFGLGRFSRGEVPLAHSITGQDRGEVVDLQRLEMPNQPSLDELEPYQWLAAAADVLLPTQAVDVGVEQPVGAPAVHDADPAPALGAVHDCLDWVVVTLGLVTTLPAAMQNVLDHLEGRIVDEPLMTTGVFDTLKGHDTEVEAVGQQSMQQIGADGPGRELWGRSQRKAAVGQRLAQHVDAVSALRHGLECPPDVVGPFGVGHHDGDVLAVNLLARVEVPDGRLSRRATQLGLLAHALLSFQPEVAGVELSDGGHDAVQQLAARRLVDVLAGRHQGGAGRLDRQHNLDVVRPVAGQPVQLVHDDQVDVPTFSQPLQHGLQLGSIGAASRLAAVDILLDDLGSQALSRSTAGVALGLEGVPVVAVVGVGLLQGGDAQVDDRPQAGQWLGLGAQ